MTVNRLRVDLPQWKKRLEAFRSGRIIDRELVMLVFRDMEVGALPDFLALLDEKELAMFRVYRSMDAPVEIWTSIGSIPVQKELVEGIRKWFDR